MRYRKKPVEIEALQWTGINADEILDFCSDAYFDCEDSNACVLFIKTLEGNHMASDGDYIIKGIKGEFYPCKPDIFEMTYEEATDPKLLTLVELHELDGKPVWVIDNIVEVEPAWYLVNIENECLQASSGDGWFFPAVEDKLISVYDRPPKEE